MATILNDANTIIHIAQSPVRKKEVSEVLSLVVPALASVKLVQRYQSLASIEFGYRRQVGLIKLKNKGRIIMNPKPLFGVGVYTSTEYCLVQRYKFVTRRKLLYAMTYRDKKFRLRVMVGVTEKARAMQHLVDHFNGVTIKRKGRLYDELRDTP